MVEDIRGIIASFAHKRLLVIGDIMLDHYIWGKVERISPEAPVPVLDMKQEDFRLGGAANVALNLCALGADVSLCGVIGCDDAGDIVIKHLQDKKIDCDSVISDQKRPTTKKTRIGAVTQQIVRIDLEDRTDISSQIESLILERLSVQISQTDAIIIEDYNKGLLTEHLIESIINLAKKHSKVITVDPKQKNLGIMFETEDDFVLNGWLLKDKLSCGALVVTRGEKGLYLFGQNGILHHIPTFAREVYDVSGAGDTVISVLTLALCAGCDLKSAATIANHAAGVVCGKVGTAIVSGEEIISSYAEYR